jgi:hypothetical protein
MWYAIRHIWRVKASLTFLFAAFDELHRNCFFTKLSICDCFSTVVNVFRQNCRFVTVFLQS